MPWSRDHKAITRARILASAASEIREKGPEGVVVAEVMRRAGLTHGGFYAHFKSKEALLAEALEQASGDSLRPLMDSAEAAPDDAARLRSVIESYMSPWHLTHTAAGCPVAALAPEVARIGGRLHRDMAGTIRARFEWLRQLLPGNGKARRRDDAIGAWACMVGGLVLARALGGEEGREALAASRRFLERSLST